MNRYEATGRLTRDPELRSLPDGTPVCQIRIAVKGMGRGGRSEPGYIDVTEFGKPGEASAKVLTQGWLVAVDGRMEYREWEQDGNKRHDYAVVGSIEFLAAPKSADEAAEASDAHDASSDDIPF